MRERGEPADERGGITVVRAQTDGRAIEIHLHGGEVDVIVEEHDFIGADERHAVVGNDHKIRRDAGFSQARAEDADLCVEEANGGGEFVPQGCGGPWFDREPAPWTAFACRPFDSLSDRCHRSLR